MELTLYEQTYAFGWAFVLGAVIAGVYMVMMVMRELVPPGNPRIFAEDILFSVFAAILNFFYAVALTNGIVRLYVLFAEGVSFLLLYLTVGKILKRTAGVIFGMVYRIWHFFADPLSKVIRKIIFTFCKKCRIVLNFQRK